MKSLSFNEVDRDYCPVINTAALIGDKWILSIIRECFSGQSRFDEFQKNLKVSRSVLTKKLNHLIEEGILEKAAYQIGKERPRFEYKLSRKGLKLSTIVMALMEWGNEYLAEEFPQGVELIDQRDQSPLHLGLLNPKKERVSWRDAQLHFYEKNPPEGE